MKFRTTYIDQILIDTILSNGTFGTATLTRGIWHDCPSYGQDSSFVLDVANPPKGLPIIDLRTTIPA